MINDTNTRPGDVVFQPKKGWSDIFADIIAIGSSRYAHCGIYVGQGKMIAAELGSGVILQDAGAVDNIAIPCRWGDWNASLAFAQKRLGSAYDWWAWWLAVSGSTEKLVTTRFTCSSLIAAVINSDTASPEINRRGVTPDQLYDYILAHP